MKQILSFLLLLNLSVNAQTNITGKITDNKNKPLAGISISLKETYDGTTSDSAGNFSFVTSEKGTHFLLASASGYRSFEQKIEVAGGRMDLNIQLKELVTELKAVIISAGAFEASDQKKTTVLNPIDIVTTASANADITAAINTLPGTQQIGESEGLFVRGGTANETKAFIDGTLVNNFYFSSQPGLAQRGRFNPFIFKGTIFSSGGYSALYGQALSSALILESIDLPTQSSADVAISYLGIGGGVQHLAKNKRSSWGISYDYTDLSLAFKLIKQQPDYFKIPVLHNADANFRIKTSNTGILKYYSTIGITKVGFKYPDIDSSLLKNAFQLDNINMYHNLSWKETIAPGWKLFTGFSYTTNKDDIKNELQNEKEEKQEITQPLLYAYKNFNVVTRGNYANAKVVIEKRLQGLNAIRFGSEYNYSNDRSYVNFYNGKNSESIKEQLLAGFAEADIYITNGIAAKVGARAEHSALLDKWNVAPRVSLAYKLADNSQASFAYGIFYQNPEKRYLPTTTDLDFAKATHYILQYQKIQNARTFRTEIFYKKYDHLFKTSGINGKETAIDNRGFGEAKGFELFWRDKKTIKNLDYWISYSYLDTKRDFLNYPILIEPPFVSKHTASLVLKKFVTKLKTNFNATYTYATGRPYYDIRNQSGSPKIFDNGRTKDFNSLSFSLNYLPNVGKTGASKFTVLVLSVTNVLGSDNIFSYNYSYNGMNKQAVRPPAKRFFYLGYFISFGIDRTGDKINLTL